MKLLHSSISSSDHEAALPASPAVKDSTLVAFPRPTPASYVAVATFLAVGAALGYIGGWSHSAPPAAINSRTVELAYMYNATNRQGKADILFIGDSLMLMGISTDLFASIFKIDPGDVRNLGNSGAKPWDIEWLVERLEPPRADGPKVAVLEIDRAWFDIGEAPLTQYGRSKIAEDPETARTVSSLDRLRGLLGYFFPERREAHSWFKQFTYDLLAYRYPNLVRVPTREPPKIWDLSPAEQKRAAATVDTRSRRVLREGAFAENSVPALRLIIAQLKRRSYRVILLLTPLRHDALESINASRASADRERRMREFIAAPPYLGAEGLVEIRDSQALGSDDDAIFIDYGHLNREGAQRQTQKLAEAIMRLGLIKSPRAAEPEQTPSPNMAR